MERNLMEMCRPRGVKSLGTFLLVDRRPFISAALSPGVVVPSGKVISVPRRVLEFVGCRIVSELDRSTTRCTLCVCIGLVVIHSHFCRM